MAERRAGSRVLDIYRAAAPSIDLFAPDIYVPDFKGTCALYARSGNPLFMPELVTRWGIYSGRSVIALPWVGHPAVSKI